MKVVKLALLGTAALAAVSVSARADDLADLKAQIEALNARISTLESTPSVPAGYQLLSISEADAIIVPTIDDSKDYGTKATNIGILPTADVPASTNIQWSGFVRAGLVYGAAEYTDAAGVVTDYDFIDIKTRAGLKVVATTDTAVGEVGVRVALLGTAETQVYGGPAGFNRSHDGDVQTDGYWGWWKITPELTLGGGVDGSLANSSNLFDNRCTCHYIGTGGAFGNGDPSQIRLSYASGPISFAVAVEDYDNTGSSSSLGVAGEMKWSGDSFGFDLNAGFWDTAYAGFDADWTVNAGANFSLGDIASVGIAAGLGEGMGLGGIRHGINDSYWRAGTFLGFTLSDSASAELGFTYTDHDLLTSWTVAGGVYYTPVSQLSIGLEASYSDTNFKGSAAAVEGVAAALVTKYSF
jgi:hypothetical protein